MNMPTMRDYLREHREEPTPAWLVNDNITLRNFFTSRTVFYPGAGDDGHAVAVFNASHTAHCFVYVDKDYNSNGEFLAEITSSEEPKTFRGYRCSQTDESGLKDIMITTNQEPGLSLFVDPLSGEPVAPFVLLAIYDRLPDFCEEHGAERIAVLFVRAEANALYNMLYARLFPGKPPFAVLLQDHVCGGNSRKLRFRNYKGPMAMTAYNHGCPEFLLVDTGGSGEIWRGYTPVECQHEIGGNFGFGRKLYEWANTA